MKRQLIYQDPHNAITDSRAVSAVVCPAEIDSNVRWTEPDAGPHELSLGAQFRRRVEVWQAVALWRDVESELRSNDPREQAYLIIMD
jgi:hypothetical protein